MSISNKKRIVFVDDNDKVLLGLRRSFALTISDDWDLVFYTNPKQALEDVCSTPTDVIVADLHMQGIDGVALLEQLQRRAPATARLLFTGSTDQRAVLRSVPVAHQLISKPSSAASIQEVIERAIELQELLADETLRQTVGSISSLPSRPRVYGDLCALLAQPDCSAKQVAQLLEQDIGICAELLKLVNSAFIGLRQRISSLDRAILYRRGDATGLGALRGGLQSACPSARCARPGQRKRTRALEVAVEAMHFMDSVHRSVPPP
jgi:FixJ family two-component response regulator